MNNYVIFTDSGCDIAPETLREWGVDSRALTFRFEGEGKEYTNNEMPIKEFYAKMRAGAVAKTAAGLRAQTGLLDFVFVVFFHYL